MPKKVTKAELGLLTAAHTTAQTLVNNAEPGTDAHRERLRERDEIFRQLEKLNQDYIKQPD